MIDVCSKEESSWMGSCGNLTINQGFEKALDEEDSSFLNFGSKLGSLKSI